MSCTRLYVYPAASSIGQASKSIILGLLKHWWENMRGGTSFIIIITSKDNTRALKKTEDKYSKIQETGSEGHFSSLYVIIEVSPPPPWECPLHPIPPYLQPLSPTSSLQPPPPPNQFLKTIRSVIAWVVNRRYLYPITLTNPEHYM